MASPEERDKRRAARLAAERREAANERRRLILGYAVAGVLGLAVVVGIGIVIAGSGGDDGAPTVDGEPLPDAAHIEPQSGVLHGVSPDGREGTPPPPLEQGDLAAAAKEAGCELMTELEDEGSGHLTKREDAPDYQTSPPTSGDHWGKQLADGAYSEFPDPIYWLHSMEHGRVTIQYSPGLPEADQLALKGLFDEDFDGMFLFPNPEMPYDVAATAWTQMIGCESFEGRATIDAIRNFRDTYRGQGPEAVPIVIPDES